MRRGAGPARRFWNSALAVFLSGSLLTVNVSQALADEQGTLQAASAAGTACISGQIMGDPGTWIELVLDAATSDGGWTEVQRQRASLFSSDGRDIRSFKFGGLAPGAHRLTITSAQSVDEVVAFDRVGYCEGTTNIFLTPRLRVSGHVRDGKYKGYANVIVWATPADDSVPRAQNSFATRTDSEGHYDLLFPNNYTGPIKVWFGNGAATPVLIKPMWLGGASDFPTALSLPGPTRPIYPAGGYNPAVTPLSIFTDVTQRTDFRESIAWVSANGIAKGFPDGSFRPVAPVARDAMAAFLYRLAGSPEFTPPARSPFVDVPTTNQFYREISWLAESGISRGWTEADGVHTFRPLEPVTREAMAAFLYRQTGSPVVTFPRTPHFVDVPSHSQFYREITWMKDAGISTGWTLPAAGTSLAEYRPSLPVNRDSMAAFMERMRRDDHCLPDAMDVFLPTTCASN